MSHGWRARRPARVSGVGCTLPEQVRLLLRLAADTGARRGELAALHVDDLHGRVLHIDRGISAEVVTTTKTGRSRRVTVGASTAPLWQGTLTSSGARLSAGEPLGPWLCSADPDHQQQLRCSSLGHRQLRPPDVGDILVVQACTGRGTPSRPSSWTPRHVRGVAVLENLLDNEEGGDSSEPVSYPTRRSGQSKSMPMSAHRPVRGR